LSILCLFCRNAFCMCFSIFKLHLTWLTYSMEDGRTFCTYRSKCNIYQEVNNDWVKRRFSLLWDLNIDMKLKLVRLVLNCPKRKIDETYSKRLLWSSIPRKDEETILVLFENSSRDLTPWWCQFKKNLIALLTAEITPQKFVERNWRAKLTFETTVSFKSWITCHQIVNFHHHCISPVIIKYSLAI